MIILSILVCTLDARKEQFEILRKNIEDQIMQAPTESVELIFKCDNGEMTTGAKRDFLLRQAHGEYIVYIDDDDDISIFYVEEILNAAKSGSDCIATNGIITTDGINPIKWRLSKDYPNVTVFENGENVYLRTTNHISPVRREIAIQGGFPDKSNAEDKAYSESIFPLLKTESRIDRPLYHYRFKTTNKTYK